MPFDIPGPKHFHLLHSTFLTPSRTLLQQRRWSLPFVPPPPHCFRTGSSLGLKKAWAMPMANMYTLQSTTIFSFFSSSAEGEHKKQGAGWKRTAAGRNELHYCSRELTVDLLLEFVERQEDDIDKFWRDPSSRFVRQFCTTEMRMQSLGVELTSFTCGRESGGGNSTSMVKKKQMETAFEILAVRNSVQEHLENSLFFFFTIYKTLWSKFKKFAISA